MGEDLPLSVRRSASYRLLGIDWRETMPCRFDDVTVDLGTFEGDAMPFMAEHYGGMFQKADASSRFLVEPMTESKLRFCQEMDTFVFRHEGRAVGLLIAHPSDWSSYYVRTAAILPDFRRRHLIVQYMHEIIPPLQRAGVARLETEVTPANIPMVAFHHDHGFMVTSTSTSDRWGMLLRFTRFLSDDAERTFVRQFCAMAVKPPKSETPNPRRTP